MKKRILALLAALALLLSGCASLLERSYTVVEPYTNRYWDTAAGDTLRAESYQDLVNSLLMLVEQRSQEGVIRFYGKHGIETYMLALTARREVLEETVLGSYLLQDIKLTFSDDEDHSNLSFALTYREEAEDPGNLMILSGTQSMVDLLRMAVREGHTVLTARFFEKTAREDITAAMEGLWQELQQEEAPDTTVPSESPETSEPSDDTAGETAEGKPVQEETDEPEAPPADAPAAPAEPPLQPEGETQPPAEEEGQIPPETPLPEPPAVAVPPCPWVIHFYPDQPTAEIVEILLTEG